MEIFICVVKITFRWAHEAAEVFGLYIDASCFGILCWENLVENHPTNSFYIKYGHYVKILQHNLSQRCTIRHLDRTQEKRHRCCACSLSHCHGLNKMEPFVILLVTPVLFFLPCHAKISAVKRTIVKARIALFRQNINI